MALYSPTYSRLHHGLGRLKDRNRPIGLKPTTDNQLRPILVTVAGRLELNGSNLFTCVFYLNVVRIIKRVFNRKGPVRRPEIVV